MRTLKHHEKKLLRKVDFLSWQQEENLREIQILRRYHIQKRDDYQKYNRLVGLVTSLTSKLKGLDADNAFRIRASDSLVSKLFSMGLIPNSSLGAAEKITASSFCRRRLPVVMVRLKMAETLKQAITLIEQGHIRVGPEVMMEPAFLVSRTLEDLVTWVDSSKIKRNIAKYNDKLDDYELLGLG